MKDQTVSICGSMSGPREAVVLPQLLHRDGANSDCFWLSAAADPDWLRIGTDIIAGTALNANYSLTVGE